MLKELAHLRPVADVIVLELEALAATAAHSKTSGATNGLPQGEGNGLLMVTETQFVQAVRKHPEATNVTADQLGEVFRLLSHGSAVLDLDGSSALPPPSGSQLTGREQPPAVPTQDKAETGKKVLATPEGQELLEDIRKVQMEGVERNSHGLRELSERTAQVLRSLNELRPVADEIMAELKREEVAAHEGGCQRVTEARFAEAMRKHPEIPKALTGEELS